MIYKLQKWNGTQWVDTGHDYRTLAECQSHQGKYSTTRILRKEIK